MTDKDFKENKVLILIICVQKITGLLTIDKDFKEDKVCLSVLSSSVHDRSKDIR